ncbi:hypothetical protein AAAT94_16735 [Intestinimonas aquisgranensis]|nr:hypothetical protein [Intestinimonas aquisgranensis]
MPDYQKLYSILFNAITDTLKDLRKQNYGMASERLMHAQLTTETLYIESGPEKEKNKVDKNCNV